MDNNVVEIEQFQKEKHRKIGEELIQLFTEKTPLTDTSGWSREKLEWAYNNLCLFIGAYDLTYDLYECVRHDAESFGFSNSFESEFYDHVMNEVEGDEMTEIYRQAYEEKFGK